MKIKCTVIAEIFKSEETGYTVFVGDTGEENMHFVGNALDIKVGDEVSLEGAYDNHSKYGKQFKFTKYEKELPKDEKSLIKYIASAEIKGVGEATAKRIVDEFSMDSIEIIRFHPEKLLVVRGITEEKAVLISEKINEQWEKWNLVSFLQKYDISINVANKVYEVYQNKSVEVIKKNPYILLSTVKSIDFKIVDKLARNLGIPFDHEDRITNGILYALRKIMAFGYTCVEMENLLPYAASILGVAEDIVINLMTKLIIDKEIYVVNMNNKEFVFTAALYKAEDMTAKKLSEMAIEKPLKKSYDKEIKYIEEQNNITFSEEQRIAINNAMKNRVSIITGGPGTGKSTIIKCITNLIEMEDKKYVLCAPTGRAAKRIKETTGVEAKTLHRLLELVKIEDHDLDHMLEYSVKKINTDYIIVDEVSMVDIFLINNLMKAIRGKTKLILVGDACQLPSVGPGSVLEDLIESGKIVTTNLKEIYRQSKGSDIVINSHKVNNGEFPTLKKNNSDLIFIETSSVEETLREVKELVEYKINDYIECDNIKDLQVLTPMKKTSLGSISLNKLMQETLNPKISDLKEKETLGKRFRINDKVMQMENNYDIEFRQGDLDGQGIYNGDIGYVTDINKIDSTLTVKFDDDKEVCYMFSELDQLDLAYTVTVHKSQGSEFDVVILPLYTGFAKLFTRNLLYTAMTRAKKLLVIVGSENTIKYMVNNIEEKKRKTGLKEKLIKYCELYEQTML